ncbi:M48 family metallopeptidase [Jannaschia sp. 2305UL9-9]|uniref:M48 family metallopeptidase n=1 Tax=Jannaschia sp. 2305UL9-9 TaxID=3121638 RepID=UPI00352799D5
MSVWPGGPNDRPGMGQGDGDPDAPVFADYFDGRRALRQRVALRAETGDRGRVLLLELPDGDRVRWPLRRIRRLRDQAGGDVATYGLSSGQAGRLVVDDPAARDLIEGLEEGVRLGLSGPSLWRRALAVSAGGIAVLALLVFVLLPALAGGLARFMNAEAEVAMGALHYEQTRIMFSDGITPLRECRDPAGLAALQDLTDRVSRDVNLPYPLQVAVLDDREEPILNAYAVAGGRITFFHSMILAAEAPEEIAAVLAHELGHVVNDDPVRHMLQAASGMAILSVLIGDVTGGGILGGTAGAALQSSYSRRAEIAADAFAHDQLTSVDLPPSALGRMFERLRDRYGDTEGLVAHFSSHPQLADRIERAGRIGDPDIGMPALTPKAWQALRAICR